MESPGGYGLPLLQLLEARGFEVALVTARHGKNVPGRPNTDRFEGRWRQKLQTYGLLAPSCRPPEDLCHLRRLLRHRENVIRMTVQPMQPMPQALAQMQLHLHHVLRDLTGVTGMRILRALVAGERAPRLFAQDRASRIQSSADTLAQALAGAYRTAPGCTLTQALALSDCTPQHIAACAQEIARGLAPLESQGDPDEPPFPPPTPPQRHPQRHAPACALRTHRARLTGVDLTQVRGCATP